MNICKAFLSLWVVKLFYGKVYKKGIIMKKKLIVLCLICGIMFCGCGVEKTKEPQDDDRKITFTDDLGRQVTVESPKSVVALLGSYAHIWILSGGTVHASADDAWDDLNLDMPDDAVNLGNTKKLNLEKILASKPDFIIASTNSSQHMEFKSIFESTNIPTAYFDVADFNDYLRVLKICCDITGREDLYEQNGLKVKEEIDNVKEKSRERMADQKNAPTVLSLRASATFIRAKNSKGNVLGEMLEALGCVNIADVNDLLLENLSLEYIMKEDPDYIFFVPQGSDAKGTEENIKKMFEENPIWSKLSAVKNNRVYYLDKELYGLKPNNRWGEAYRQIEDILENG